MLSKAQHSYSMWQQCSEECNLQHRAVGRRNIAALPFHLQFALNAESSSNMTLAKLCAYIHQEWKCDSVSWKLQRKLHVAPPLLPRARSTQPLPFYLRQGLWTLERILMNICKRVKKKTSRNTLQVLSNVYQTNCLYFDWLKRVSRSRSMVCFRFCGAMLSIAFWQV